MPLIQLDTSCDISDQEKQDAIVKEISRLAAVCIGKPEQYVMACVRDNVTMTMGGTSTPTALVTVKSIGGLNSNVNQKLSAEICQLLNSELGIEGSCIYITFEELPASHWGWNSSTFG